MELHRSSAAFKAQRLCRSDGDIPRPAAQQTAVAPFGNRKQVPRNGAVVYVLERRLFDALFAKHQPLGSGEEGVVDLYTCSRSPTCVAVKRIDNIGNVPIRVVKAFAHEIHMHAVATVAAARHGFDGIVPLLGIVVDRTADGVAFPLMSIMPVYSRGTLEQELDAAGSFTPDRRRLLHRRRWAEGDRILEWLHGVAKIVHGDAHLGNWFLGDDGRLLLGDFGRSQCGHDNDFRAACVYERTEFAFAMAGHGGGGDKWKLGAQLGALEQRRR